VYVAREEEINTTSQHSSLKRIAHVNLIRRCARAVHGTVCNGDDPWRLRPVDSSEISLKPLDLLVGLDAAEVSAVHVSEWAGICDVG